MLDWLARLFRGPSFEAPPEAGAREPSRDERPSGSFVREEEVSGIRVRTQLDTGRLSLGAAPPYAETLYAKLPSSEG